MADPARHESWWVEVEDRSPRPYLILTRDQAIPVLHRVVAAPITRTVRGIPTEVAVGVAEGLAAEGVASFDNLETIPKAAFTRRLGRLKPIRAHEVCEALRNVADC
ncbi:MAG: type II toxin-antitoxin system PemK/MazF family toxin [Actinomycetota bacterium]